MQQKWPARRCVLALACLAAIATSRAAAGSVLYVDDDAAPGGDGTRWSSACDSLQDALDAAPGRGVTEIRVAGGVYRPDDGEGVVSGDRQATFRVRGLALVGGFAGVGAPDPDERDPSRYPAVLSGDLLGDDADGFAGNAENSHRVVVIEDGDRETRLDGFVIRGGNADGPPPHDRGGGIAVTGGAPTVSGCVLASNAAFAGGGLYAEDADVAMLDVEIRGNRTTFGGGLYCDGGVPIAAGSRFLENDAVAGGGAYVDGTDMSMTESRFEGNRADFDGGGLYATGAGLDVSVCAFSANVAGFHGGAFYGVAGAERFDVCKFRSNAAADGGAVALVAAVSRLAACSFEGNVAADGGAVHVDGGAPDLAGCRWIGNSAQRGGGLFLEDGAADVSGGRFVANDASDGGAAFCAAGAATMSACVFESNQASRSGGGVAIDGASPLIRDCVFDANAVSGGFVADGGAIAITDSAGAVVESSAFTSNEAKFGGAIHVSGGGPVVTACTLTGNRARSGGALHMTDSVAVVTACRFRDNSATKTSLSAGGAVYCRLGAPSLRRCVIEAGHADRQGGGVYVEDAAAEMTDCRVAGNTAVTGGGVYSRSGVTTLVRCVVSGNTAANGGGMHQFIGSVHLQGCLFAGNAAVGASGDGGCGIPGTGGGFETAIGDATILSCTFVDNRASCGATASGVGGGISGVSGLVANSLFWGNRGGAGSRESAQVSGGAPQLRACCVQGLTGALGGEGNIGADPRFAPVAGPDPGSGEVAARYRLRTDSPCVDAGDNLAVPAGLETDLDGNPRFVDVLVAADTGFGDPPIVDIGTSKVQSVCGADVDGDGAVGFGDLVLVLSSWGPCPRCPADVDGDRVVGFGDLLAVLSAWGPCLPTSS